jgi:hypothetical protein
MRFLISVTPSDGKCSSAIVKRAIHDCLQKLHYKKYKIGRVYFSVNELKGAEAAAIDLVETLRVDMSEKAIDEIASHEESQHDRY